MRFSADLPPIVKERRFVQVIFLDNVAVEEFCTLVVPRRGQFTAAYYFM